jgi:hypothetical protein
MYGEKGKEAAWYHDYNDDLYKIQPEEMPCIPEDPPVYNVFASVSSEILNHGSILIDTPGFNSPSKQGNRIIN